MLTGGPGLSTLIGSAYPQPLIGYNVGIRSELALTNVVWLSTGLYLERKGVSLAFECTNLAGQSTGVQSASHDDFYYASLPVTPGFAIGDRLKFLFEVGPYFAVLIRQQDVHEACPGVPRRVYRGTSFFPRGDFGATALTGCKFETSRMQFLLAIRSELGLVRLSPWTGPRTFLATLIGGIGVPMLGKRGPE